jgi:hypothetical protein
VGVEFATHVFVHESPVAKDSESRDVQLAVAEDLLGVKKFGAWVGEASCSGAAWCRASWREVARHAFATAVGTKSLDLLPS